MTAAASHALDVLASSADAIRRSWLRIVGPYLGATLANRETRVPLSLGLGIAFSLVAALFAPIALLAIGPLVWGVPHLLADVRYLVVPHALHRRRAVWLGLFAPVAVAAVTPLGARAGLLAVVGAAFAAEGSSAARRAVVGIGGAFAVGLAWRSPAAMDLVLAHLHNVVALALLWAFAQHRRSHLGAPFALFAVGSIAILSGATDSIVDWHSSANVTLGSLLRTLAPFPTNLAFARRLLLAFAFAQSVHYAVWLRAIPDETRITDSIRSFRQSVRSLVREMGPTLPALAVLATVALAAWGVWDLANARAGYLRFAGFHGHLEIALAALAWAERRRP